MNISNLKEGGKFIPACLYFMKNIFVYDSLQTGLENNSIIGNSQFLGKAKIDGFLLYDVSDHPGIIPVKTTPDGMPSVVFGEVWRIDEETEIKCDVFKNYDSVNTMYSKETHQVTLIDTNEVIEACVYVWDYCVFYHTYRADCQREPWRHSKQKNKNPIY